MHIDFLTIGNVATAELDAELRRFVYSAIRKELSRLLSRSYTGAKERIFVICFPRNCRKAERTRLYSIPRNSPEWTREVNSIVDYLYRDDSAFTSALLKRFVVNFFATGVRFGQHRSIGRAVPETRLLTCATVISGPSGAADSHSARGEVPLLPLFGIGIFDAFRRSTLSYRLAEHG